MGEGEPQVRKEDEVDLLELARVIWSRRLFIIKVTGVFVVFGLVMAFTSKVEFEASCKLLPESQEDGADLGRLGGLAGLAGFNLSTLSTSGGLSTELYPEIINSSPFLEKLINTPIYFERQDTTVSSFVYFTQLDGPSLFGLVAEYTIGLPGKVISSISGSSRSELNNYDLVRFSKDDWKIIESYRDRLNVSVDAKTGTVLISAVMPDPVAAAKVTDLLVKELTQNVIEYKIEKSNINLEFVQERFVEAKADYQSKQEQLAIFTDSNRNISNSIIQNEYERIQNELDIAFEVYKGLATQLEQAKIKVKEETPVFTVLEPVKIPVKKSRPKRLMILVFSILFGLGLSSFWSVYRRHILRTVQKITR